VLLGFTIGASIATVFGAMTGYSIYWRGVIDPTVHALRTIPGLAWSPCSSSGSASTRARSWR
jgi:sulfonate transport system permease protein